MTEKVYKLRVWIAPDFSVFAADLPGCASCGDDIDSCLANIREAFIGVVMSYADDGEPIPWVIGSERPLFHEERVLTV